MFFILYTLFFYYLCSILTFFLIKKVNTVNDAALHMSKTFTRYTLTRYIKTQTWSCTHSPSVRKNKYTLALFIINNINRNNTNDNNKEQSHEQEQEQEEQECLVCYNEQQQRVKKNTIVIHKCYRCSFTMCTNCERRVHDFLCPLCKCVLSNAHIEEFVKKYVQHETLKNHFILILLSLALVSVQFELSSLE